MALRKDLKSKYSIDLLEKAKIIFEKNGLKGISLETSELMLDRLVNFFDIFIQNEKSNKIKYDSNPLKSEGELCQERKR